MFLDSWTYFLVWISERGSMVLKSSTWILRFGFMDWDAVFWTAGFRLFLLNFLFGFHCFGFMVVHSLLGLSSLGFLAWDFLMVASLFRIPCFDSWVLTHCFGFLVLHYLLCTLGLGFLVLDFLFWTHCVGSWFWIPVSRFFDMSSYFH